MNIRVLSRIPFRLVASILLAWALVPGFAQADTIDFSQFGPEFSSVPSGSTGTTVGGVGFTVNSADGGALMRADEGSAWHGIFPTNAALLFGGYTPGAIEILFSNPIQSLTIAAQPNDSGFFTETAWAYNAGASLLDTESANANAQIAGPEGTIPYLTLTGLNIVRVLISTTHDAQGIAIYSATGTGGPSLPTPLPGALPLFVSGFGLFGLAGYARKRRRAN